MIYFGGICDFINIYCSGQPTKVEFHVTVMSLDSINEGSMVTLNII